MNKKKTIAPPVCADFTKKSLFESIELNESELMKDQVAQRYAGRVGLICKICLNRNYNLIFESFVKDLNTLIVSTCSQLDNELHKTENNS